MTETPLSKARFRRHAIALALAGASLTLSMLSCIAVAVVVATTDVDLLPVQSKPQPASAAQVEAVAHVTLPIGTVFLTAAYSNGLETHLSAKFRLPRAGLDAFITAGAFTAPLTIGLRAVTAKHNVGGGDLWDPDTAISVSGLNEQQPITDGTYRSLLLNLDAPDTITVYLYASRG